MDDDLDAKQEPAMGSQSANRATQKQEQAAGLLLGRIKKNVSKSGWKEVPPGKPTENK